VLLRLGHQKRRNLLQAGPNPIAAAGSDHARVELPDSHPQREYGASSRTEPESGTDSPTGAEPRPRADHPAGHPTDHRGARSCADD